MTESLTKFDCFMDKRSLDDIDPYDFDLPQDEVRVYAQQVMIMSALPIGFGLIAYVVWWIICKCYRELEKLQTKFIATLILLLFLIHPALTKKMVDVFNCDTYDGVARLTSDYQVKCYEDEGHRFVAFFVALPALIIWGLGIPATVLIMMSKASDKLNTENVK